LTEREALRLALEALETPWNAPYVDGCDLALGKKVKAITALREALAQLDYRAVKTYHEGKPVYVAQPEQEPVAVIGSGFQLLWCREDWAKGLKVGDTLYTSPPQPQQEQNLNCKSTQARLAAAWGYTKVLDISDKRLMEMPPQRKPLTMQPIIKDPRGVLRFKKNELVDALYEHGVKTGLGLNELHGMGFTDEDRQQFAQLIGYSVSGYADLSYVTDEAYEAAEQAAHGIKE